MDVYCQGLLCHAYSFKRFCFFLFLFFVLAIVLSGAASLIIVFVLKPHKPVFSLKTVTLDLYKLNAYSGSTLFLSSVITLTLNAQNPNKLGISYRPSRLHVYFQGLRIGTIRVPGFLQPAHSSNVSVPTRVLIECLNVTHILAAASESKKNKIQMRILGDVRAHLLLFHVTLLKTKVCVTLLGPRLPLVSHFHVQMYDKALSKCHPPHMNNKPKRFLKWKVALECDINIDLEKLVIEENIYNMRGAKDDMPMFPTNPQNIFLKCALAFYI